MRDREQVADWGELAADRDEFDEVAEVREERPDVPAELDLFDWRE